MDFSARLDDLAVLRITGEDTVSFLHAQLSNDISGMGKDEARLAAYCNPKGRMLGSLLLWRETPEAGSALLALVKADVADSLLKRLRMFVLRAKVVFETAPLQVSGLSLTPGSAARNTITPPLASDTSWQLQRHGSQTIISAPTATGGPARWWLIGEAEEMAQFMEPLNLETRSANAWHAQDIEAGLGWVEQGNLELFIPQSLNYDLNGGVSFTKGCYPGQEVVARAHFRGAVKRRGIAGTCSLPDDFTLQAGMDIFDAKRPGSPAGRIINAAGNPESGGSTRNWHLFMEINLADISEADFRASSAEGPVIELLPLPYSLDAATE